MAEAGSPVMAEMQPQRPATRLQDRLGNWARETLTPTGRAEVMAQKQIDSILAQVPEEKRAQAMEMLEARRPDLVAGKMEDAKGSLVRDAAIGAAVVGSVAGVGIWKKEWIGKNVKLGAENVFKLFKKTQPEMGPKTLIDTVLDAAATAKDVGGPGGFPPDKSGISRNVVRAAQKATEGGQIRVDKVMASWWARLRGQKPGVAEQVVNVAKKVPMV